MSPSSHRARIAEARQRKAEARTRINDAKAQRDAARARLPAGQPDINSESFRAAERAVASLSAAENDHAMIVDEENYLLGQLSGLRDALSDHGSWLHDPDALGRLQSLAHSKAPIGNLILGEAIDAEGWVAKWERARMMAAEGQPVIAPGASRTGPIYTIVQQARRKLTLLDLVPHAVMEFAILPYLVEGGSFDAGAAEKSELAVSAGGEVELTPGEARARTISSYFKTGRESLADVPGLQQLITERLAYTVERRLEHQLVSGDGVGENLTGILNTALVSEIEHVEGTLVADAVRSGITVIERLEGQPSGIALHPDDIAAARTAKATTSGVYLGGGPFLPSQDQMWDLPLATSTAVPKGTALVGDFERGCTIFIREGMNVRLSDSDQDDFLRGRLSLLGELRACSVIWRPRAFAIVHLS